MTKHNPLLLSLLAGTVGGFVFSLLSLPLPWMLGSSFGVIVLSRFAVSLKKPPRPFLNVARVVLGLAIGSQFSADMLDNIGEYAASLAFMIPYVALTGFAGWLYFHKALKLDSQTAFLCAMPGGLAELVLVGEDIKANLQKLTLIQGVRILALVYSLPFIAGTLKGQDVGQSKQVMPPLLDSDPLQVLLLLAVGGIGWFAFHKLRLSGAPIVGPMIVAAGLSIAGLLPQEPPDEVFKLAQLLLGTSIGGVFIGHSMGRMTQTILQSLGFLVLLAIITPLVALGIIAVTDFSFLSALLAYAPGGQAEMSLIALILDENTGYVALHHLFRLVIIVSFIPVFARWIFKNA